MLGRSAVHDAFTAHVCQVREVVDGIYAACDTDVAAKALDDVERPPLVLEELIGWVRHAKYKKLR